MGFEEDVRYIISQCQDKAIRQTAMFRKVRVSIAHLYEFVCSIWSLVDLITSFGIPCLYLTALVSHMY